MKKIALMIVCLVASCAAGFAQAPDSAAYQNLLDKTVRLSLEGTDMTSMFETTFKQFVTSGQITEAQCHDMSVEMVELMQPRLVEMCKELWRSSFTYDELKQVEAWLSSPVGKKLMAMGSKGAELSQKLMTDPAFMQQLTGIVGKYLK